MAAGRIINQLLKKRHHFQSCAPILVSSFSFNTDHGSVESAGMKSLRALAIVGAGVSGIFSFATVASADDAEHGLACPRYPWPHKGILNSYDYDHSSIRHGQQVYQQVCSSCHSFSLFSYRDLIGVAHADEGRNSVTADIEVFEGPNDEGETFVDSGKQCYPFHQPHRNEAAPGFANGGAYPSALSLITKARHNGQNCVFSLLTGYCYPTAGIPIQEGLHYNPYFSGSAIVTPEMAVDDAVECEDSSPATESQMGKAVVTFLSWATGPEMEERRLMGFKWIFVLSLVLLQAAYYHRLNRSVLKSRKLRLDVDN